MWDAIKDAIQTNGRTLRFIAIIAALAVLTWIMSLHLLPGRPAIIATEI